MAAQKAEADFFNLLRESNLTKPDLLWKDVSIFSRLPEFSVIFIHMLCQVKRKIADDPRYDAVGSSSLREELFNTFLKAQGPNVMALLLDPPSKHRVAVEVEAGEEEDSELKRQEKKQRAVKQREEKVRAEQSRVVADIGRSRQDLDKEEGEREFRCARNHFCLYEVVYHVSIYLFATCRTMLTDAIRDPKVHSTKFLDMPTNDPPAVDHLG